MRTALAVVALSVSLFACGGQPSSEREVTDASPTTTPATAETASDDEVMSSDFEAATLDEWKGASAEADPAGTEEEGAAVTAEPAEESGDQGEGEPEAGGGQ